MTASELKTEKRVMRLSHYDLDDRKHPERNGRYINLTDLLLVLVFLADEPDGGINQLRDALLMVAKS